MRTWVRCAVCGQAARFAAASLAMAFCGVASGQDDGRRIYEEQLRVRLDRQLADVREVGVDGGGWLNFVLFNYDDASARKHRTLRQYQLRGWASANYRGEHRAYVRALMGYDDWNSGQNPVERRGDEFTCLEVERAWYEFNLERLLFNRTGQEPDVGLQVKVGRQFTEFGTGFALSMPLDAVQITGRVRDLEVTGLLGLTDHDSRNIDDSLAVYDHQQRCLWGVQLRWLGFDRHRPFAYYLHQNDHTEEDPVDTAQRFDYSSRYVGAGCEGSVLLPNLHYHVEAVGEFGRTYSDGVTDGPQDSICAMAVDALVEYIATETPTKPRVGFEYIWASGDDDRSISATSTAGGNTAGTRDYAFNAFGYRDTGLAFAPRMSNLHIYALNGSLFPLECVDLFEKLEVGSKVFFYHKSADSGAISDATADNDASYVGWEWDLYCNWRITSDLSWTVRYGAFMPGAAFGNQTDCRQFLLTSVTLSF